MKVFAVLLALIAVGGTDAQTLQQLEQAESRDLKIQRLQDSIKVLDDMDAMLDRQTRAFNLACMKAVGAKTFCGCLASNRPVAFSFADYVAITTRTREENKY